MAFVAFNVAVDVILVSAVLRANNVLFGRLEIQKLSHWAGPPGRGGWCR
jgi:hypothetical protein